VPEAIVTFWGFGGIIFLGIALFLMVVAILFLMTKFRFYHPLALPDGALFYGNVFLSGRGGLTNVKGWRPSRIPEDKRNGNLPIPAKAGIQ